MNADLPYRAYDLGQVAEKAPARIAARKRADYMIGRAEEWLREVGFDKHVTILLAPLLGDVAQAIKDSTLRENVSVEVTARLHEMIAGIQEAT